MSLHGWSLACSLGLIQENCGSVPAATLSYSSTELWKSPPMGVTGLAKLTKSCSRVRSYTAACRSPVCTIGSTSLISAAGVSAPWCLFSCRASTTSKFGHTQSMP